jgi:hypothetical protein
MVGLRAAAWHRCDHRPAAEKDLNPAATRIAALDPAGIEAW